MSRDYSRDEQMRILKYIIENEGYCQLRGRAFWVEMENSRQFDRTWQSMKEHFKKKIFPSLHIFQLQQEEHDKIRFGYLQTALPKKSEPQREEFLFSVDDDD